MILGSAATVFSTELEYKLASLYLASILFQWNSVAKVGPLLVVFAMAGAILASMDRAHRTLRIFGITLLSYFVSRLIFAAVIIAFDFWRGPATIYFEFFVIPVYAIFAVQFFTRAVEKLWQWRGWGLPSVRTIEAGILGSGAIIAVALTAGATNVDGGYRYPPATTRITDALSGEVGLQQGSVFRGRVANVMWRSMERSVDWSDLYAVDAELARKIGNEMRLVGLNTFGIPTLFEYTPTISPFFMP